MKYICNFLLLLNYLAYIVTDIVAWRAYGTPQGLLFLLPLVLFPIAIKLASKVAVSQADEFFLSEWNLFVKKLKWGNTTALLIVAIVWKLFIAQEGN